MDEPLDTGQDLDEGTESSRTLDHSLVDLTYLRVLCDRIDHLLSSGTPLGRDTGDRDQPRIIDRDLCPSLLLDRTDRLTLRTDHLTDLVRIDLHSHDPGRMTRS